MTSNAYALPTIERPRLLNKLQAAEKHKLTLISAPPGYGKTTLATQFVRQSHLPVAWHRIETRDRDVPNLHQESLRALKGIFPGIEALNPQPGMMPSDLASLVSEYLRKFPGRDAVYILDDIHNLYGASGSETWLQTLINSVPPHCHLILISRLVPDIPFDEMLARGELLLFGQDDLRLTSEEIVTLASKMLGKKTPKLNLSELENRLEGWPAGTILAFYPLPTDIQRTILKNGGGPEALFNRLAQSMLSAQPPDLQDFLLASSTLDKLTPEVCRRLLPHYNSELLYEVQARNLFVSRASKGLAYHSLFRGFLQQQLKTSNLELYLKLHKRAAECYKNYQDVEGAFDHYILANEVELAVAVAEEAAAYYFISGKEETLLHWEHELAQTGGISANVLYRCAIVHGNRLEYEQAEANLHHAEAIFRKHNDQINVTNVDLERATIDLQNGKYSQAIGRVTRIEDEISLTPSIQMKILNVLGFATLYQGNADLAVRYLEQARELYEIHADTYGKSQCLQTLALAYSRLGRLAKASACLQEVVSLRHSLGGASALAGALNNLGFYYYRDSDYKQALATFDEALQLLARAPEKRVESYLLSSYGHLKRDLGYFDEAAKSYYLALSIIGNKERALQSSLLNNLATVRRWEQKWFEALTLAQKAEQIAVESGMILETNLTRATILCAWAHLDDPRFALNSLDDIIKDLREIEAYSDLVRVYGICAEAALHCQDVFRTIRYLREGIAVGQQIGTFQALASEIAHSPGLTMFLSQNVQEQNGLLRDLKRLQQFHQGHQSNELKPERYSERLPFALRIYALGQESVLRDDHRVATSTWRSIKAREFFFYLLFLGPSSREQICLLLWPESSTSDVRRNFHSTLYNVRRAIGADAICHEDERYFVSPKINIWCDATEFEALSSQAQFWAVHDPQREDRLHKAVNLYKGEFLIDLDSDWIQSRRAKLSELYVNALLQLSEMLRLRNALSDAIEMLRQALVVDPYNEHIHRLIMSCFAQNGDRQKVLVHLHNLETLLLHELNTKPSPDTLALISQLLS